MISLAELENVLHGGVLVEDYHHPPVEGEVPVQDDLSDENVEKDVLDDNQTDKCRNEWRGRTQCPR